VVVQSASVAQVWLLGGALGLRVPLVAYAVVVPLVSLLTMLPISVFGVGVREVSLVTLLAPLAVAPEAALALGVLWFALSVAASLIGGVVYLAVGDQESAVSSQQSGVSPEGTEGQGPSQREAA
jgi:hypothetical protein